MAGHSKWANIRHKKSRVDAKKGKVFSRLAKEIIVAVKEGGADPKGNTRLRLALQKARSANMPNDIIERNIKKASSDDSQNYDELTYELYGHGGVGIIVETLTDNKNRTASDMRIIANKCGGSIASSGAVSYNFKRKGVIQISKDQVVEDELFLAASDAGAEDFDNTDGIFLIITPPSDLVDVKESLENNGFPCAEFSYEQLPQVFVECDEETIKKNDDLIERLEQLDDVDAVYHNMKEE